MKGTAVQRGKGGGQVNWNQVFYFSEIATAGSIKTAADQLGLSPSTLSEHLSQLEADLNVKLFDRCHRKLVLTADGTRLFQSARQMFDQGNRFLDFLSPRALGGYPVSIGVVPGSSYHLAHQIIRDYLGLHHDVSANVHRYLHDEMERALLGSQLDFAFTDRRTERRNLVQCPVAVAELRFFVSSKISRKDLASYLAELPLIMCRSERKAPTAVEDILDSLELTPRHIIVCEYPSLVESLCRDGAGVAVLGWQNFENDPSVRSVPLPRDFPSLSEKLFATWVGDGENSVTVKRLLPLLKR